MSENTLSVCLLDEKTKTKTKTKAKTKQNETKRERELRKTAIHSEGRPKRAVFRKQFF